MTTARLRAGSGSILAVAVLSGAAVLVVELAAVRLLAPWFGTSAAVWTNVIGVLLFALALGYLVGARLSIGGQPARRLGAALVCAAFPTAWLPFAAGPVAGFFLPNGLGLDQAAELLPWGSLAASFALFLPPAVALGAVGPLAVEWLQRTSGGGAGTAGGRVLAASTLGSIAGTFATTHGLLPVLGLSLTFQATALVLFLLGLPLLLRRPAASATRALAGLVALGVLGGLIGARLVRPAARPGTRLLEAVETPYQSARVVEDEASGLRRLEVNEGFDSFQSVWAPEPGLLPAGFYYNLFALPPHWARVAHGEAWRVCVLGLGAGTAVRVLEGSLPEGVELVAVGVEIDPDVVRLARRWMGLAPAGTPGRTVLAGWDARAALRVLPELAGPFDEVIVDAYANQVEIPPHLCTREFFGEVHQALRAGGVCAVNVGGFGLDDPVVRAVGWTLARAFGTRALAVRVPFSRNVVLFAQRGGEPPEPGSRAALASSLGPAARGVPEGWRWFEPDGKGPILWDDRAPIERLQRDSLARAARAAREEPRMPASYARSREARGGDDPVPVATSTEQDVLAALEAGAFDSALEATRGLLDPRLAARLERRVRHHAGDLDGALAVGARGLKAAPGDLELLLGSADTALSLGFAERAHTLTEGLAQAADALPADAPKRDWWTAKAAEVRASAQALDRLERARSSALRSARLVSLAGIVAASATLVALARRVRSAV